MTQAPATGLWGPGDFPADYETIEDLLVHAPFSSKFEIVERNAVVDVLIDLAHDLDARGLVLVDATELREELQAAYLRGAKFEAEMVAMRGGHKISVTIDRPIEPVPMPRPPLLTPPDPNTGS